MGHLRQRVPRLHVQRFVPALEGPADLPPVAVEPVRPRALQVLHPRAQVRLRRLQGEMEMIAHDHKRMHQPAKPRARFRQAPLERLGRPLACKDRLPVVPPVDYMVARSLELQPQFPRHRVTVRDRVTLSRLET